MAIQGIFLADFSQYNAAVDGADAKLRKFTSATTSHDTASRQFNSTTDRGATSFGQLSQGLSAADKTLAAFGVHIGPEIHALDEMSQAAGKSAADIGKIGTASLVAAAALGGWEIGRSIAKFFDLDTKVASLTDHILHLGVESEIAGAKQDSINLAISRGAAATVSYNEAIQFNTQWVKNNNVAAKEAAEANKEHEKAMKEAAKAAEQEADALQKLQQAHVEEIQKLQGKLFGTDAIKAATDYVDAIGAIENVANRDADTLQDMFDVLTKGIDKMVEGGRVTDDLTNQFEQYRIAVVQAQQSHTVSITKMETDEARFKRENDELAKAMHDNFVVIGQSAQEAAQKVSMSFSQAMDAVRAGKGTLSGSFQSIAPGTPGSSIRYDDYGNPYGYIPGVNNPGKISASGGNSNIFVDASGAFFDTPADAQRLADKVKYALGTQASSQGGR